jgi:hypothetical protein
MVADDTVSSDQGNAQNTVLGAEAAIEPQTPDQFYTGEPEEDEKVDPKHATEGMTTLGYSEASRIEDTAAAQEAEREAYEKEAAKAAKK